MDQQPTSDKPESDTSRRGLVIARLATITGTLTLAAFGPGLALAQASPSANHNEVLMTTRR
jgi:hypothetical protein